MVRNFPLIFRGEVRNFPRAEFCPCKPPYHRMPCASPRAPICFVPALLQVLSTNREGGAGSRIICEWRATPSTEVISGTMVIAFSQGLLGIAIPGSLLLPMHCRFGRCGIFPLIFWTGAEFSPCRIFPCGKIPVQNSPPPCTSLSGRGTHVLLRVTGIKGMPWPASPVATGCQGNPCSTGIRWGVSPAAQMGCLRNRSGSPSGADQP